MSVLALSLLDFLRLSIGILNNFLRENYLSLPRLVFEFPFRRRIFNLLFGFECLCSVKSLECDFAFPVELWACDKQRNQHATVAAGPCISKADQRINELLQDSRNNNASPNFSVLSQRTVESHVHRFLRKLNISNRTELSMAVA